MSDVLKTLKDGVRRFQAEVYPQRAAMYAQAGSEPQRPHTLFITCADSRIDPIEITAAGTGDIFVTRNIGNMVPAYGEMLGGVSAVIEYAVSALGVGHVVVCGHSDCGAMKALLASDSVAKMPAVRNWLRNAHAALSVAETLNERDDSQRPILDVLTEQNVLLQLQHLKTHPSVAGAMAQGHLTLSGWIYEIGTGDAPSGGHATAARQITLMRRSGRIGDGVGPSTRWVVVQELQQSGVELLTGVEYERIEPDAVVIRVDGEERRIAADTVVIAAGQEPETTLASELALIGKPHVVIGGASGAAGLDAGRAFREGFGAGAAVAELLGVGRSIRQS